MFHLCLQSIYTTLCADKVVFNSEYNRSSFLQGARQLLKRMPDFSPRTPILKIEENSTVLPVPIADDLFIQSSKLQTCIETPHILWNHRWEYDKAPERLFSALQRLKDEGFFSIVRRWPTVQQCSDCFDCYSTFQSEIEHWDI